MKLRLWFLILSVALLTDCSFRDQKNAGDPRLFDANATFGFNDVNSIVFTPYCLSCHGSQKKPPLNTYAEIKAAIDKIQTEVFVKGAMPPRQAPPLSDYAKQVLQAWIAQGSPEVGSAIPGGPTASPTPDPIGPITRPVKWEVVKAAVFQPKCFNCHYPGNPDGYTDYTDLSVLKDTMGSILYVSITKPQMPPAPDKLSEGQKDILAAWVIDGMDMTVSPSPTPGSSPAPSPASSPIPAASPSPIVGPNPSPSPSPTP